METTFKYKGKIITTPNLEKKLKRMKLSIDDIEIIDNFPIKTDNEEEENDIKLYRFFNKSTGYTITSIYNKCPEGYEQIN